MKILVCPHQMGMGGSQLNAVEMAVAVRRHGHEATVYAPPGILTSALEDTDIPWIQAPDSSVQPGKWTTRLSQVIRNAGIDLVHAYEWRPCLQASFAGRLRTPVLMSVMAMDVPRFLPRHLPIVVGIPSLERRMRTEGRTAYLLEPPVDMQRHFTRDVAGAREKWCITGQEIVISAVSMLTTDLEKLQGILSAIAVVDRLAQTSPLRFLIAGDGEGLETVRNRAEQVNRRHGRTVIQPVGFQIDPVSVYEAADIVLGMGSSAIKGLAHGKALIVQGEGGFWRVVDESSAHGFLDGGWFGTNGAGARDLLAGLSDLMGDKQERIRLGDFGRNLVEARYGLSQAATALSGIYVETVMRPRHLGEVTVSLARSAATSARYFATMQVGSVVEREKWARRGAHA